MLLFPILAIMILLGVLIVLGPPLAPFALVATVVLVVRHFVHRHRPAKG